MRLPIPIEELAGASDRDVDAVAYGGYPEKRGLDLLCAAWAEAAPPGARLVVGGIERELALWWLRRCGVPEPPGVEWAGELERPRWLELVGRARVLVNASRWEEFGLTALEAMSAGTPLVTVPTGGAYEALPLAHELAPELVAPELSAPALATALGAGLALAPDALADYGRRARELLAPYREQAVVRTIASEVLPALGVA